MEHPNFVYHMVPKGFTTGDQLYPLNQLKVLNPAVAAEHSQKYAKRQPLLEQLIHPLNCLWNDVLMFSPVHPQEIMQTFRDAGYDLKPKAFFQVPLSRFEPQLTAVYFYAKQRKFGDHTIDPDEFAMLADVDFEPLTILGDKLTSHIEQSKRDGQNPVMFGHVPHILYKGTLSTDSLMIIEC